MNDYLVKGFTQNVSVTPYKGRFPCYVSALKNIFNYYRITDISELDLFLITGGINIIYNKKNIFGYDFETSDLSFFKGAIDRNVVSNKRFLLIEKIFEAINAGFPIICFVMSDCLKYHIAFQTDNKREAHAIIVYGYNKSTRKVIILDSHIKIGYEKYETYVGELDLQYFVKGLICYWVLKPELNYSRGILELEIQKQLKRYLMGDTNEDNFLGQKAIISYLDKVLEIVENITEDQLWDYSQEINFNIVINGPCYIGNAVDELSHSSTSFLYKEWYRLANRILRAGYIKNRCNLIESIKASRNLTDVMSVMISQLL